MNEKKLRGWHLVFAAGCFPATAGLMILALGAWSATGGREAPWLSLMGPHSFSAAEASRLQPDWYALWLLTLHLCGVNLAMSGVTISLLAWFGLRNRVAWASRILWVLILWVGINDAAGLVYYRIAMGTGIPYALVPLTLGGIGLIKARSEIRRDI